MANELLEKFLTNPLPLWDSNFATNLCNNQWKKLLLNDFETRDDYSIVKCVIKNSKQKEITFSLPETNQHIHLATPSHELSAFYLEHGLIPVNIKSRHDDIVEKICGALKLVQKITPLYAFILEILRSVQIIEAENPETDISYSHPEIPFSIFFSVCEDNSVISNLRVAESIIHESMHLFLTLIESQVDLILLGSTSTHYSPWRDEPRPLRGVLHGMFVFKAVSDFYKEILISDCIGTELDKNYVSLRIRDIDSELATVKNFQHEVDLTNWGKILSNKLQ